VQDKQLPITTNKGSVAQGKKQEDVAEKVTESGKKGESVPLNVKPPENDSTGVTGIIAMVGEDSIKNNYAILRQQIDELKREIDGLRKKVDALEKENR
jgi:hypothetical protein